MICVAGPVVFRPEGGVHVGRVRAGVTGTEQLIRVLEEALRLPDYFGRTWDALSECLRDLSWLPPGRVSSVHDALPDLPPKDPLERNCGGLGDASGVCGDRRLARSCAEARRAMLGRGGGIPSSGAATAASPDR